MIWEQTKQREFRVQKGHTARAKEEIPVNTIHILKAVLCADCEVISDGARDTCVVCGSRSLLSLGRVLGGTIGQERAVLVPTNEKELRNMFTLLVNPGAALKLSHRRPTQQEGGGHRGS